MITAPKPTSEEASNLYQVLQKHQEIFFPVLGERFSEEQFCRIDLTEANHPLRQINFQETEALHQFIFRFIKEKNKKVGVGGYLEKRVIYSRSEVFAGSEQERRSIHLGIDLWAPAFTPIFAPLDGFVHSIQDNEGYGDYGPTIILEHQLEGIKFYTLYGHLSRRSMEGFKAGQFIPKGRQFTELGPSPENGDWPPHLHFQIMLDLEGKVGDYPGVAAPSEQEKYQENCPDPNLILNLQVLK